MKQIAVAVLAMVLITGWACTGVSQTERPHAQGESATVTVTEKDDTGHVEISKDAFLEVKMDCIPGTGYSWQIVRNDSGLLKQEGEPVFERQEPEGDKVGGIESQIFRFKAISRGRNTLELHYARTWEKRVAPQKTYRITVDIR